MGVPKKHLCENKGDGQFLQCTAKENKQKDSHWNRLSGSIVSFSGFQYAFMLILPTMNQGLFFIL